jgi:hypothetical protein
MLVRGCFCQPANIFFSHSNDKKGGLLTGGEWNLPGIQVWKFFRRFMLYQTQHMDDQGPDAM